MQKIIEDREKRKKKWIRLGKISAISLVSIIIAVRILCSSYAFCNWYLPLASHSLGIRITADEVKFTPFSSKKHLNFRGLQVEIKGKVIFTASSFKTKISFYDLIFCNQYTLDNVDVKKASLVIYDLQKTDNKKGFLKSDILKLGFLGSSDGKELACNAGDLGSIPGLARSPGEGNGYPLQDFRLENPMDRGGWWAPIHGSQRVGHH